MSSELATNTRNVKIRNRLIIPSPALKYFRSKFESTSRCQRSRIFSERRVKNRCYRHQNCELGERRCADAENLSNRYERNLRRCQQDRRRGWRDVFANLKPVDDDQLRWKFFCVQSTKLQQFPQHDPIEFADNQRDKDQMRFYISLFDRLAMQSKYIRHLSSDSTESAKLAQNQVIVRFSPQLSFRWPGDFLLYQELQRSHRREQQRAVEDSFEKIPRLWLEFCNYSNVQDLLDFWCSKQERNQNFCACCLDNCKCHKRWQVNLRFRDTNSYQRLLFPRSLHSCSSTMSPTDTNILRLNRGDQAVSCFEIFFAVREKHSQQANAEESSMTNGSFRS